MLFIFIIVAVIGEEILIDNDDYILDLCPTGDVVYLSNNKPRKCITDNDCPNDFYCSNIDNYCCGAPSQCPNSNEIPLIDESGRYTPCSAYNICPDNSKCQITANKQKLCCISKPTAFSCPISGIPYPNPTSPQQCSLTNPIDSCPLGSVCQPSNFPGTNICCSSSSILGIPSQNICPEGWQLADGVTTFCEPKTTSCPSVSSCVLSPFTRQFVCCIPNDLHDTLTISKIRNTYTCLPPYDNVELMNGKPRQCRINQRDNGCSSGYWCQMSKENPLIRLCCGPFKNQNFFTRYKDSPPYLCPNRRQVAALKNSNQNIFCLTDQECPLGSSCQASSNDFSTMICCYEPMYQSTIPQCPPGMTPQTGTLGYVPCDSTNQCQPEYACTESLQGGQALCCRNENNIPRLVCPNQQSMYTDNGNPRFCSPNQISPCPTGYSCLESTGASGVYLCCSNPSLTTCPSGYSPSTNTVGNNIYCSPTNANVCPADAQCLQAQNLQSIYLCCRSTSSPRVCPNNQNALIGANGQLEYCNGPGTTCSNAGYTCQLSTTLSTWVCCGAGSNIVALCADGRETYTQQLGQTYSCNPFIYPTSCPSGYECSQSNQAGINVCCLTNSITTTITPPPYTYSTFRPPIDTFEIECPTGWSSYNDANGAQQFCTSATDMSCPHGFSCAQSSNPGIFLCCRIARNLECQSGYKTLLINNNPRLCTTKNINSCPNGYTCQESTINQVFICCSSSTPPSMMDLMCADGQIPAYIGSNVRHCSRLGQPDVCPPSYICSSSNRNGINVCCHSTKYKSFSSLLKEESAVCGPSGIGYFSESDPSRALECTNNPTVCPDDFYCQPSMINTNMYCCQEAKCSNSDSILPEIPKLCSSDFDCDENGMSCMISANILNVKICCRKEMNSDYVYNRYPDDSKLLASELSGRCLGRKTLLISGNPVSCINDGGCKPGYECSKHTTHKSHMCCEKYSKETSDFCPDNREPIRSSYNDEPITCDIPTACPTNSICKANPSRSKKYCCSQIAFCKNNTKPLIDLQTGHAKRCFGKSTECNTSYNCSESTVENVYICCSNLESIKLNNEYNSEKQLDVEKPWIVIEG